MRVALPVPVDRLFDYTIEGEAGALVGRRVRVAFGGQKLVGLIVPEDLRGGDETGTARSLSPVEEVLDEEPAVSEELIRVLADEAHAIFCPIGLAIAHGLPPGSAPRVARPWALTLRGERALAQGALGAGALGGEALPILTRLAEGPATLPALARALPGIAVARRLESLLRDGLVERRHERKAARARVPTVRIARIVARPRRRARGDDDPRAGRRPGEAPPAHRGPSGRHLDHGPRPRRSPGPGSPARPRPPPADRDRDASDLRRDRGLPRRRRKRASAST